MNADLIKMSGVGWWLHFEKEEESQKGHHK